MGFDEARIILNRENHTYYTGETVYGTLVFQLNKVKFFRGLYLKAKGYCDVHWTEEQTREVVGPDKRNKVTESGTVYNSHETYFEQKICFMEAESYDGKIHLNAGSHEFPFQFHIPVHCPSSYESRNGSVRYELRFVADRPFDEEKFDQEKFHQEKVVNLEVIAKKDLNEDPYCKEPADFDFLQTYSCWCMSVGVCKVTARLPASGYCPGQTMRVQLDCDNTSNVEMDVIIMKFKEEITFRTTNKPGVRREKNSLVKIKKGPIPGNTKRDWIVEMEVPVIDPRNLDACKYIDVDYEFEVTVIPSGCHTADRASRRIILGHVPLKGFEQDFKQPNNAYVHPVPPPQQFPGTSPPGDIPQPYQGPVPHNNAVYPRQNPPYADDNPPYPSTNPPYPSTNPTYRSTNPPYPGFVVPTGNDGSNVPLLQPGTNSPYPPPQQTNPSAPQPDTPDCCKPQPAFNPNYKE